MLGDNARMLDLNHPQTRHIFAAGRFEDTVLDLVKRIISSQPSERRALLDQCEQSLEGMRKLNAEHFGGSQSISSAIDELHDALRGLAASASPHMDMVWPAFTRLESENGFGTVFI
jgi:hypothetical protein